mmetsp:Transcript_16595/g.33590  ORF Transcript_16595/g.33590 Transcript_16595/m.33590 type:complete len:87 (-) Transcript_16595:272-532(-)
MLRQQLLIPAIKKKRMSKPQLPIPTKKPFRKKLTQRQRLHRRALPRQRSDDKEINVVTTRTCKRELVVLREKSPSLFDIMTNSSAI